MPVTPSQTCPCVLVVEPDAITRDLVQIALERAGFVIRSAQTGERALLVLRERRDAVDWLVTREALPGLVDGPMLADEYHIHHPSRPVLIGGGTKESASGTIALSEPLSPDDIVSQLRVLGTALHPTAPVEAGGQALAA